MGHLLKLTNTDHRFYPLIGPFLSRRAIVAELGVPLWDEDGKCWYVLMENPAAVSPLDLLGFAAIQPEPHGVHFGSAYVVPGARGNGVYGQLLAARLADHAGERITVTANEHTAPAYLAAGFVVDRQTKQFWFLHREASHAEPAE